MVFCSVYSEGKFYSVDLGLSANSGFGRKFRSSFILRTPYSYCNLVNSIAVKKTLFSSFILVNQIHSKRKHTCVRYTSQMKRYDLTQRWALYRKPLGMAHDIFIDQVHRYCLRGRRWNSGGGGGILPYIIYTGICRPIE